MARKDGTEGTEATEEARVKVADEAPDEKAKEEEEEHPKDEIAQAKKKPEEKVEDEAAEKDDDDDDSDRKEYGDDEGSSRKRKAIPRRGRKSAPNFESEDFKKSDKNVRIQPGRGHKLADLDKCKDSIESASQDDLLLTHRLLFPQRGKPSKRDIKNNILAFSGYLPVVEEGVDPKEQAEIDEEYETKMGQKAYKLTVPQLKTLCDVFGVNRNGVSGSKEGLVDAMLDFLGEPNEQYLNRKKAKKTKKEKKTEEEAKDDQTMKEDKEEEEEEPVEQSKEYDDVDDEKVPDNAKVTDDTLRRWVRAYVRCHHMGSSTFKQAMGVAEGKFGVDMTDYRQRIKELLTEEM